MLFIAAVIVATITYFTITRNPIDKCQQGITYLRSDNRNVIDKLLNRE